MLAADIPCPAPSATSRPSHPREMMHSMSIFEAASFTAGNLLAYIPSRTVVQA
eukprot:CAMPEP_0177757904 /NCGR_PEP_ID=MMETSP0491_2-20121128/3892_1 /TAXON_ID=63592 /ORGANISM="Tetraselmis chuii, Strain PLY429" /LENGTH=52 /DNA_ID=CAMNT_0019273587 /DNA_START=191 /DNA_END=349 /DNA_ORIENTATION=-